LQPRASPRNRACELSVDRRFATLVTSVTIEIEKAAYIITPESDLDEDA
jgi:hypothetical protein